jgi:hypothetical protein
MRLSFLTMLAVIAWTALSARAANLVTYPFNGTQNPTTQGGVTATGFLGNGSDAVVGTGSNDGNYAYILITENSTNVGESVSNRQYAQFTVTAPKGNGMQLAQIRVVAARGGDPTPRGLALRWSFDGFKSNLGQQDITSTWPNKKTYVFNVNAFVGGSVTFRFYAFAKETNKAEPSIRFDNLVVAGSPIIYAPTVTPKATRVQTSKSSYIIRGTAYSTVGISRVEVAKTNVKGVYSGANGTTTWNYNATSLHYGTNTFYVRAIDKAGDVGPSVRVSIKRIRNTP